MARETFRLGDYVDALTNWGSTVGRVSQIQPSVMNAADPILVIEFEHPAGGRAWRQAYASRTVLLGRFVPVSTEGSRVYRGRMDESGACDIGKF